MPNKSMFLAAVEKVPDAVEKIAALSVKVASMHQITSRGPVLDPLENPELGPERAGNGIERGRNIGKLVGTLGGAALGGIAGHALGGGLLSGATHLGDSIGRHLPGYDENTAQSVHDGFTDFGKIEGTGTGALVGGLVGRAAGGGIGAGIGRITSNFASPEAQAAEKIKQMDPATGLAHIRMLERSGHVSPSVLQAMKDTYETRRGGLQAQIQSGVPVAAN